MASFDVLILANAVTTKEETDDSSRTTTYGLCMDEVGTLLTYKTLCPMRSFTKCSIRCQMQFGELMSFNSRETFTLPKVRERINLGGL